MHALLYEHRSVKICLCVHLELFWVARCVYLLRLFVENYQNAIKSYYFSDLIAVLFLSLIGLFWPTLICDDRMRAVSFTAFCGQPCTQSSEEFVFFYHKDSIVQQ